MAKLTLADIAAGFGLITTYNANNALLEAALENTLSRDGTAPNTMSVDLDMNSQRVVNLANAISGQDAITLSQLNAASIVVSTVLGTAVTLDDVGGFYTLDTAEGALQEIFETPSETTRRVLELATQAEVDAGSDAVRVITPATLVGRIGSETLSGLIELATQAEVDAGTDTVRAVTPATLAGAVSQPESKSTLSDQPVTSSTVLVDITGLTGFTVDAATTYRGVLHIPYTQNIGDIKVRLIYDQSSANNGHNKFEVHDASGNTLDDFQAAFGTQMVITTMTDGDKIILEINFAFISNATLAGTLKVQFAQNTSDANPTTIEAPAYMTLTKVS